MKRYYALAGGACAIALATILVTQTSLTPPSSQVTKTESLAPVEIALNSPLPTPAASPPATQLKQAPMVTAQIAAPAPPVSIARNESNNSATIADKSYAKTDAAKAPWAGGASAAAVPSPSFHIGNIMVVPTGDIRQPFYHDEGHDKFEHVKENPVKVAKEEPVSTFSIDVDTSSYSYMRAELNNNVLPQKDSVRAEEMINYFPYDYAAPESKEEPFKASVSVVPTPWNKDTKLMRIGIKGYQLQEQQKPHSNLVFLIDTSGSMNEPNKLPLVQNSLKLLLDSLKPDDTVGIVTYAGNAGIALEPTPASEKAKIMGVIDTLQAYGSTAGAEGIRSAYQLAEQHFDKHGVNRIILTTDGDFNVGITDQNELKSFVERERNSGIFLSVLGFGMGNYNDAMMQALAQNGNGNAAYIDNLSEARKTLVQEAGSTLFTIAKDVKIQVEFNPSQVAEYRLIGYETRLLNREDFNNDKVDAGDIGAGHAVTALYEITPVGSNAKVVDDLRYQTKSAETEGGKKGEYGFIKIRYKLPSEDTSKLITFPVGTHEETKDIAQAPDDMRFATAVAAFAQILRGETYTKSYTLDDVITLAQGAKGADSFGYRAEFINLVRLAKNAQKLQPLGQ